MTRVQSGKKLGAIRPQRVDGTVAAIAFARAEHASLNGAEDAHKADLAATLGSASYGA